MARDIALFDIDHVVANSFWRDVMIGGDGGWDTYYRAAADDAPVPVVVELVRALRLSRYNVFGLTARPERWRQLTVEWLMKHDCPLEDVLMRPDDDYRSSPLVKLDLVRVTWPDDYKERVAFLVEDRDDVCAVFRAEGIICLQCHVSTALAPSVPFTEGKAT